MFIIFIRALDGLTPSIDMVVHAHEMSGDFSLSPPYCICTQEGSEPAKNRSASPREGDMLLMSSQVMHVLTCSAFDKPIGQ